MSRTLTVTSLDKDVSPASVMLEFNSKTPIAIYNDAWLYRMAGIPHLPGGALSERQRAIYGAAKTTDEWAVSTDMRSLIDWIDATGEGYEP